MVSLTAWGPGMVLVTAQELPLTVEDHTSHHTTFLLSVPCKITFPYGGPQRPTVGVACMCDSITNSMGAWDDPGHSTKAASHRGGPHFTPRAVEEDEQWKKMRCLNNCWDQKIE